MKAVIRKSSLRGELHIPSSKSHTIRGVIIGMLTDGVTELRNPLASDDCLSAVRVIEQFGAKVTMEKDRWLISGVGGRLLQPNDVVNTGNSGMTTCMIAPLAATCDFTTIITGDWQIRKRPMQPLLNAMNELGALSFPIRKQSGSCPVFVQGSMLPGNIVINGLISEYISGLLLAAPLLKDGETTIRVVEPKEQPYLTMTLQWMEAAGINMKYTPELNWFQIPGGQTYRSFSRTISGDWSTASFPLVASVCTDSEYIINGVDYSDPQADKVVVDILQRMGADITVDHKNQRLLIKGGKPLHGTTIRLEDNPDAFPILCIAAAYAVGDTKFLPVEPLRYKETDRAAVMQEALSKMNVETVYDPAEDSLTVKGTGRLQGAVLDSHDDHRIAMACSVAGMIAEGETILTNAQAVSITFPTFFKDYIHSGANMTLIEDD